MSWNKQPRTLEVAGDALPKWRDAPLFVASRLRGKEKLGRLYDYEVDVSTVEAHGRYVSDMHKLVDVNRLVGKRLTVKIAIEGNGTWVQGVTQDAGAVSLSAGRSYHASVRGSISLFAYQQGMKFMAAKGRVDVHPNITFNGYIARCVGFAQTLAIVGEPWFIDEHGAPLAFPEGRQPRRD